MPTKKCNCDTVAASVTSTICSSQTVAVAQGGREPVNNHSVCTMYVPVRTYMNNPNLPVIVSRWYLFAVDNTADKIQVYELLCSNTVRLYMMGMS